MSRLGRFPEHRWIGTRDTMTVFDCDDPEEFEILKLRIADDRLVERNLVQSFAPDTLPEARNRSFRPR